MLFRDRKHAFPFVFDRLFGIIKVYAFNQEHVAMEAPMPSVLIPRSNHRFEEYDPAKHGLTARLTPTHIRFNSPDVMNLIRYLQQFSFSQVDASGESWYWVSYPSWSRGEALEGDRWSRTSGLGGTYTMQSIMFYQHIYRPGSKICRPSIILDTLVRVAILGEPATYALKMKG